MPTTVALAFPWGRYHANPWGRHVNEAVVEWPPSPWRMLRALYSVWRCRVPELDAESVEGLLSSLAALPSFVLPPSIDTHTRHYLPDIRGGTDKAVDAFTVVERDAAVGVDLAGRVGRGGALGAVGAAGVPPVPGQGGIDL